jgi:predicted outer membrane protein
MNNLHRMLVILGCGALCASASAKGVPAPEKFLATAMQDGIAEIALCQMALRKSANPAVKSFADRMIKDRPGDRQPGRVEALQAARQREPQAKGHL